MLRISFQTDIWPYTERLRSALLRHRIAWARVSGSPESPDSGAGSEIVNSRTSFVVGGTTLRRSDAYRANSARSKRASHRSALVCRSSPRRSARPTTPLARTREIAELKSEQDGRRLQWALAERGVSMTSTSRDSARAKRHASMPRVVTWTGGDEADWGGWRMSTRARAESSSRAFRNQRNPFRDTPRHPFDQGRWVFLPAPTGARL
jgi:hypothetical protein